MIYVNNDNWANCQTGAGNSMVEMLTKIKQMAKPIKATEIKGAHSDMLGKDVHANQKKALANMGPATIAISRRTSGATIFGAAFSTARVYRGKKNHK